jgi:hypothetical protein
MGADRRGRDRVAAAGRGLFCDNGTIFATTFFFVSATWPLELAS